MTPLPYLAAIRVDGRDGRDFLHRQLSADINGLASGEATFACLCQPKGRVIAVVAVIAGEDRQWLLCAHTLAEKVSGWLSRFVFRDDVRFSADDGDTVIGDTAPFSGASTPLDGLQYAVSTDTRKEVESDSTDAMAFRAHELASGLSWLDQTSSEAFLPQMIGADAIGALNYRKGCYPGQEIVARTHYLGKLKQRPALAWIKAAPSFTVMDKIMLRGPGGDIDAQVVDGVTADDETRLLLAARSPAAVEVDQVVIGESSLPVTVSWPDVPSRQGPGENRQASATT
ncbi:CAF17-like 4Fe-4S cluster assembly/insertion protein YgfZ [Marinihelvus fidelis]|nr:hypothetical protein [Marinihelvus fidelis]